MNQLFKTTHTIAVVGLSNRPERDSYRVAAYMQAHGYRIIPINPLYQEILGERCYPNLMSAPQPIDLVNVFRQASECLPIAQDAVAINAKTLWLQLGIVHHEAAQYAQEHGSTVIMNRCLMIDHRLQNQ